MRSGGQGRATRVLVVLAVLLALCASLAGCGQLLGPQPPESLKTAATDATWATKQLAKLPRWSKGQPTRALFFRPGAEPLAPQSGQDNYARYANALLKGSRVFNPDGKVGPFDVARHVEVKAAAYMRKNVLSYAVLVINNTDGVCGQGLPAGCTNAVPAVLPEDYRLVVWWPDKQGSAQGPTHLDGAAD